MRKIILYLCVALLSSSALAAKTMSVAELNQTVAGLATDHKSDAEIANRLADVELTEQLTPAAIAALLHDNPGPQTAQQLLRLSVESSQLPPPPSDLPTAPPLDPAAQAELLQRATALATQTFTQLPTFTADKESLRFQNGLAYIKNTSGNGIGAGIGDGAYSEPRERVDLVLIANQTTPVVIQSGVEQSPANLKQKDPGGALGQVSQGTPGLPLLTVLANVAKSQPAWVRWQLIDGRQVAVFAFAIPKKQSPYKINYCCFPSMEHIGSGMELTPSSGTLTTFDPYKAAAGYHGELYIDAKSGVIVRLITRADPKKTDFVSQEDIRVDYEPVQVGAVTYILPTHSTILTTVAPNGDAYVKFTTRRTLFGITYKNYRQ